MRFLNFPVVTVAIAPVIALSLALPAKDIHSSVAVRSQVWANGPNGIAGTPLVRRLLRSGDAPSTKEDLYSILKDLFPSLQQRGNVASTPGVLWRAPGSSTFIVVQPSTSVGGTLILDVLNACCKLITYYIQQNGDGIMPGGYFNWMGISGVALEAMNANNHQTTWGVLGAAINALLGYMEANGFRQAQFDIYDGENQVGVGLVYQPGGGGIAALGD